jgi:hypothetical protein
MKIQSVTLVFILLAGYAVEVWGQTTSSGMFGSRTLGSAGSSMSSGSRGFSGSSLGGMGMSGMGTSGMGGTGMGGMGMSGMGMSGSGTSGMGMSGMGSSYTGSQQAGQFIGGGNTGGQTTFVGGGQLGQNQSGRTSGQYGQYGQTSTQYGQFGNTRGGNQSNRANQQNFSQGGYGSQNNRNQTQIPTVRRADFEYSKPSTVNLSSLLTKRLQKLPGFRSASPLEASFQGDTLVLKGVVATAHARDLAERLARLEPGIDQVQNDLVVEKTEILDREDSSPK